MTAKQEWSRTIQHGKQQYGTFQHQQHHHLHSIPAIAEEIEIPLYYMEEPLPCCGFGIGWFFFFAGFLCVLPWFVGAFILCFLCHDHREKPGLAACTVATFVALLVGFRFT